MKENACKIGQIIATSVLLLTETEMKQIISNKNMKQIKYFTDGVDALNGSLCNINFWKMKKRFIQDKDDPPAAKKDAQGNIITSSSALQNLYLGTYEKRFSPAVIEKDYGDIFKLKTELWSRRNEILQNTKSGPWDVRNIELALEKLKKNKSRNEETKF